MCTDRSISTRITDCFNGTSAMLSQICRISMLFSIILFFVPETEIWAQGKIKNCSTAATAEIQTVYNIINSDFIDRLFEVYENNYLSQIDSGQRGKVRRKLSNGKWERRFRNKWAKVKIKCKSTGKCSKFNGWVNGKRPRKRRSAKKMIICYHQISTRKALLELIAHEMGHLIRLPKGSMHNSTPNLSTDAVYLFDKAAVDVFEELEAAGIVSDTRL